jgi:glycerol uptake facilitator protein
MSEPSKEAATASGLAACFIAELAGTFLLVFFGCGSVHVAVLTGELSGLWQVAVTWGVSIMLAIYSVGPISGGHINPAITVGLAVWGLFPARRVAPYILAQLSGAFVAACVLFVLFQSFLDRKEQQKQVARGRPGSEITAMCYGEYFPNPGPLGGGSDPYNAGDHDRHNALVSEWGACMAEFLGTAILALSVLAVTEGRNPAGPGNLAPVFIGLTVSILIVVIAPLTQACFNPAREFGPRLFASLAGWGTIALPGPRGLGFLTVYIISPVIGSITGMAFYRRVLRPSFLGAAAKEE